jgi:hypothetical protein
MSSGVLAVAVMLWSYVGAAVAELLLVEAAVAL